MLCTGFLVVLFMLGLPGTVDYVRFMGRMKTLDMRIPFDWVFSVFVFSGSSKVSSTLRTSVL